MIKRKHVEMYEEPRIKTAHEIFRWVVFPIMIKNCFGKRKIRYCVKLIVCPYRTWNNVGIVGEFKTFDKAVAFCKKEKKKRMKIDKILWELQKERDDLEYEDIL